MPFIGSVSGSRSGRLFPLGGKPAIIDNINLTAGNATDTFSWSAPNNNGLAITKYGYQTTTNNGSTWSAETETASTSAVLNTQYSLNSFKIRVRAFNAAGWGEYSNISSSGTVAWNNVTGTDTETDTVCGPAGCSQTETDTVCGPAGCSETATQNCECGTQSRTRTRTSSRTRTRTRTSSRTRTRSTQQYTRSGSTSSSITYGEWSEYSAYTYSEWGAYGAYSAYTYSEWGAYGNWSGCSGGTQNAITPQGGGPMSVTIGGLTYEAYIFNYTRYESCGYCQMTTYDIVQCSTTGTYSIAGSSCSYIEMCA